MKKLTDILSKIALSIAAIILLFMAFQSVRFSFHTDIFTFTDYKITVKDSPILVILFSVIFIAVLIGLSKLAFIKCPDKQSRHKRLLIISIALCSVIFVLLLLYVLNTLIPQYWDQKRVYHYAQFYNEKNYKELNVGYLKTNPHQVGMIFFESILLRIINHYGFLQAINAFITAAIVFLISRLSYEISDNEEASLFALLIASGCLPLFYFSSVVYGDIYQILTSLLISYLIILFIKRNKTAYLIGAFLIATISVPIKKNSYIFLIAFLIFYLLQIINIKKYLLLVLAPLIIVLPFLSSKAILTHVEKKSGVSFTPEQEISSLSWLFMGLIGDPYGDTGVGYFTGYEFSPEEAKIEVANRIKEFTANPGYAADFFKIKIYEQWLDPMFNSRQYTEGVEDNKIIQVVYGDNFLIKVRSYMNIHLSVVYVLALIYVICAIIKEKTPLSMILVIGFLGGFFFTLVWEASARYAFPYFLLLLPMTGSGLTGICSLMKSTLQKIRKNEKNLTDSV